MPRRVAVKVLHPQHAENPTVRARFKRELDAACRVSHENVVSVFDMGEDPHLGLYYVMELVRGTSLNDYLNGDPLPWPFIYRVATQLTNALHAIHSAGIVHRDLKPQNIMLVERSNLQELVKVLDFGIASLKSSCDPELDVDLTGARMVLGTPPYMSPEQTYMKADRERLALEVDAQSDIYALGVILYELASGRRPFAGDAHDIVVAHRLTRPMPLDKMVGVSVPASFADLVMRCLAKQPADRPQSARELGAELKALADHPVRHWGEATLYRAQEQPTEINSDPIPVSEALPIGAAPLDLPAGNHHVDTAPSLQIARRPSPMMWTPIAALAATAVAAALLLTSPTPLSSGEVLVDRVTVTSAREAATPEPLKPRASRTTPGQSAVAPKTPGAPVATAARTAAGAVAAPSTTDTPQARPASVATKAAEAEAVGNEAKTAKMVQAPPKIAVIQLVVTTEPTGAEIFIDDEIRGISDQTIEFESDKPRDIAVVLRRRGYEERSVSVHINPVEASTPIVIDEVLQRKKRAVPNHRKDPFKDL